MPKVLSKEELELLVEEQIKGQLDLRGQETDDKLEGMINEAIQEGLKDFKPAKETPFSTGEEDPTGGFVNFADFAKEVYDAGENCTNPSERLKGWLGKSNAISKTVGSPAQSAGSLQAGGALIPPEYSNTALTKAKERSQIMSAARVIPMSSNVIEIPYIKDFNNSNGTVAGNVKFRWVAENAAATGNDVEFDMIELKLREANCLVYVGNRLMDFSPVSIQPFITTAVDDALDLALANAFINGTGAGQPKGILNSDVLVSVAKETGQLADTLVYENTLKMLARFYGNTGVWYANRTIIPQLGVMQVSVGTGGSAVFLAGGAGSQFGTALHGAPLHYEQVMPILGDVGDLTFCDWSQYLIGQFTGAPGMKMTESAHLKFDYRQHAFQFTFYVDGQPWWPSPFSPLKGDTISPFVTTAARA
ncbi:MAG: phage major capsid protein [Planctomycetaceae bacterium]|nr:MAG: phage major capsid protein [Planctomycetaceae bacterium]